MFSILSYIVIVVCTSCIGILYSESLKKRQTQLKEMDRLMMSISDEIRFLMTPLPQIFENISRDSDGEFGELFGEMAAEMKKDETFDIYDVYDGVQQQMRKEFYFNENDLILIRSFFRKLGENDVMGEQNSIEFIRAKMKRVIEENEESIKKDSKLAKSLSLALGLVIVILIL